MKKILVFGPLSPHTEKFTQMIKGEVDYHLVCSPTNLKNVSFEKPFTRAKATNIIGLLKIISLIFSYKPDIIHLHSINLTSFLVCLIAPRKINIISTAWGSDVAIVPKYSPLHRMAVQYVIKRSKNVTATSDIMMQTVRNLWPEVDIRKIHYGISPETKKMRFAEKENFIFSSRGHSALYNIPKIVKGFRKFSIQEPEWKLVIAGAEDAEGTPLLHKMTTELGLKNKTIFTGFLTPKQLAEWNARAKINVSVPSSDGRSVSLTEAVYSNCICFVSELPSNHEIITHGKNGFFVQDNDDIDFSLFKQINIEKMENWNDEISEPLTFGYNKKEFLKLYD
jgi:glycosyltransferase involved in cell wall biosynthesis